MSELTPTEPHLEKYAGNRTRRGYVWKHARHVSRFIGRVSIRHNWVLTLLPLPYLYYLCTLTGLVKETIMKTQKHNSDKGDFCPMLHRDRGSYRSRAQQYMVTMTACMQCQGCEQHPTHPTPPNSIQHHPTPSTQHNSIQQHLNPSNTTQQHPTASNSIQ